VGEQDVPPKLKDLRQSRPIAGADEGLTRRDIARRDAPMAQVDRPSRGLVVTNGREHTDELDIGPQLRLVVFDDHDIIPALVDNRWRDVAWGQERIHRDHTPCQDHLLSERLDGRELMRFVVNSVVGEGDAQLVRQCRYQVCPRRALFCGTAQRFPLQGDRTRRRLKPWGQALNDLVGPCARVRLELVSVDVPQDGVACGGTGGSVGAAEGLRDPWAIMAAPCGHRAITARATQQRTARQGADGGSRMAFPTRLAHVRNHRKHCNARTRMCSHQAPPLARVVAHVGMPGKQNPTSNTTLSRFWESVMQPLYEN
jgi:hypothetical protein